MSLLRSLSATAAGRCCARPASCLRLSDIGDYDSYDGYDCKRWFSGGGGGGKISMTIHPSGHDSSGEHSRRNKNKNKNPRHRRQPTANTSHHRKERGQSSYKFVDRARIRVTGGAGGNGSMANRHIGRYKRRPDGGHGGDGGNVVLVADPNEQTLGMSIHHHSGEDGKPGGVQAMNGRTGRNKIVRVPCGVIVKRILDYDEYWDEEERVVRKYELDEAEGGEEGDNSGDEGDGIVSYPSSASDDGRLVDDEYDDFDVFGDDESSSSDEDEEDIECIDDEEQASGTSDEIDGEVFSDSDSNSDLEDSFDDEDEDDDDELNRDDGIVSDEDLVNTGVKASDGMYHWRPDDYGSSNTSEEDEWVASSADIYNYEREKVVIADLDKPGSFVVLATGGRGGTGSIAYAKKQWTPGLMANAGERRVGKPGEQAFLELELKLIADIGLVGYPNAGKSSLLASLSMARPEIAPYPFTTLHPLVGTIKYRDGFRVIAADVPGLVDGAAEGRGRGHDFLRHLERTKSLLYIVDAAGVDGRNPVDDLRILAEEIASYGNGVMMNRPSLLVANKMDLIPEEEERESLLFDLSVTAEEAGIDYRGEILGISAGVTGEGLGPLSKAMRKIVTEAEAQRIISEAA